MKFRALVGLSVGIVLIMWTVIYAYACYVDASQLFTAATVYRSEALALGATSFLLIGATAAGMAWRVIDKGLEEL